MEDIKIKGERSTDFIPSIDFIVETGECTISGESSIEETEEFYQPLLDWLKDFTEYEKRPLSFNVRLSYYNTSTSRSILNMLHLLKTYEEKGGKVDVVWFYNREDVDEIEEIEDYMIDTGLNIVMKAFLDV